MKTLTIIVFLIIGLAAAGISLAQAPAQPAAPAKADPLADFTKFAHGMYKIEGHLMLIIVNRPMMTERLATYGGLTRNRAGEIVIDIAQEKAATKEGKDIRDRLLTLTNPGNMFAFKVVQLEYDRVNIVKYLNTSFETHLTNILKAFDVLK